MATILVQPIAITAALYSDRPKQKFSQSFSYLQNTFHMATPLILLDFMARQRPS